MSERDQFIADIIAELSRQKEANNGSLEVLPKIAEADVFRKMCYSYPMVVAEDVQDLSLSIDKIFKRQSNPISRIFCLDETFVENIQQLSDQVDGGALRLSSQNVAAIVFLKFPKFLLACNKSQLSDLFSNYDHSLDNKSTRRQSALTWLDIIKSFRSLIFKCSSSYMSELTLSTFSEGFHLVALLSAISTLDKMVQLCDGRVVTEAEEEEALREIEDSQDSELLTLEGVFHRLIKEVITSATPAPDNEDGSSSFPIVTHSITSGLKDMWLHLIFIYRDILIRIPALVSPYLPPLCEVLIATSPSATAGSSAASGPPSASLFDFSTKPKGPQYPTSSECMFAMILSNLASHLTSELVQSYADPRGRGGGVANQEEPAVSAARAAVREYLTTKQRLAVLVDIWERMNAKPAKLLIGSKKDNKPKEPSRTVLNVEAANFLLDVCMLYACDLSSGNYTYASSSSTHNSQKTVVPSSKHFEYVVSSRALPSLLSVLSTVIQYSTETFSQSESRPVSVCVSSGGTAAVASLSSCLLRFLCLSTIHSSSISKYILDYPDLHTQLASVATASWGEPVKELKDGSVAMTSERRIALSSVMDLFSPADAVGFLTAVLLNGLSSSTSAAQYQVLLQVCEVLEKGLVLIKFESTLPSLSDANSDSEYVVVSRKVTSSSDEVDGVDVSLDQEHEEVSEKAQDAASSRKDFIHVTAVVNKLSWMLSVLLSNKDGATLMRGVFKSLAVTSTETALMMRLQLLFKSFIDNSLLSVNAQMKLLPTEPSAESDISSPLDGKDNKILFAHEFLKKQLKALQVLSQGFTSNKTD